MLKRSTFLNGGLLLFFAVLFSGVLPDIGNALNIHNYSDTISQSRPGFYSNHTFEFTPKVDINPGGYMEFTWPADFTVLDATSTFDAKNVELYVNGVPRVATTVLATSLDTVTIAGGAGGSIRYTLNATGTIAADDVVRLLVGNHTSQRDVASVSFATSTGTTTIEADVEPILNSSVAGTHKVTMATGGGSGAAYADFVIALVEVVGVGRADTTETVPPYRFNGAPTSSVSGTSLSVEISLETDEIASCRFDTATGTAFSAMSQVFDSSGLIVHTKIIAVSSNTTYRLYVRCIDDEGNFNIDDYPIIFFVGDEPTGESSPDGTEAGDGSGTNEGGSSGNTGDGDGSDSGSDSGSNTGGGGSGGGGGGSSGSDNEGESGGGFESDASPFTSGDAEVIISGYAFPGSTVYAIVDGYAATSVRADNSGKYELTIEEIARGAYTFGVYAIDNNDVKSSTFSTSFTVTGGKTSKLSNVNIMPSILVEPDPVDIGQAVTISGYALPDATVTIENQKDGSSVSLKTFTTTSDSDGAWSITESTSGFSNGTYKVRARSEQTGGTGISTDYSDYTFYGVGQAADVPLNPDLNRDGFVNLTDFSILLFWWGGDGGTSDPPADINQDGSVSLTDFSILLFNWTG